MPEIGEAGYLVGYLSEIGEAISTGTSLAPIGWRDVKAWSECGGVALAPDEYKALIRLSRAYVAEYFKADGVECDMPHVRQMPTKAAVEQRMKSLFAMLREPADE